MLSSDEFPNVTSIALSTEYDEIPFWNEICAQAIDLFGLPGDRYMTSLGDDFMNWHFRDTVDQLLFRLKFGEWCVSI
jgi:hypothetical protein